MNIAYALGYVPRFEGWEYSYVLIICWSVLIMLAGLLLDILRDEPTMRQNFRTYWMTYVIIAIGFFSIQPAGLLYLFLLNVVFQSFAPVGASCIAATFTLFAILSFIYCMVVPGFRKTVKER